MPLHTVVIFSLTVVSAGDVLAQKADNQARQRSPQIRDEDLPYPPTLPGGVAVLTDTSPQLLKKPETISDSVAVAQAAPTIDLLFYPQQTYPGKPWSNWGGGCFADGKHYSAIGDHFAIGRGSSPERIGNAFVFEYDPSTKQLRTLVDVAELLKLPHGHYRPGKIHSRVDLGRDGWLYYATHRGSPRAANNDTSYKGDWILRTNPKSGESEIVVHAPVPKHSIPNSLLDPQRMIFYGGTAAGPDADSQGSHFFAYDLVNRKLLYSGPQGPARCMMLAGNTGRLYFVPGNDEGELMRFDPADLKPPVAIGQTIGIRAATRENSDGMIYTVSKGQKAANARLWRFNTKSEQVSKIGTIAVGEQAYVASIDIDPSGRFLYYVPGAHGGGYRDGSSVVQYDLKTNTKKVIAFLHPFYQDKYGLTPKGTYSCVLSTDGSQLFITWNVSRGTRAWDCCALTVIHIPKSERS